MESGVAAGETGVAGRGRATGAGDRAGRARGWVTVARRDRVGSDRGRVRAGGQKPLPAYLFKIGGQKLPSACHFSDSNYRRLGSTTHLPAGSQNVIGSIRVKRYAEGSFWPAFFKKYAEGRF